MEVEENLIEKFNELKFNDYSRKGQDYEFIETDLQLKKIAEILDGVKDYTPKRLRGRVNLHTNVQKAIKEFVDICNDINEFNATNSDSSRKATQIKQEARQLYDQILVPDSGSKYSTFPALALENRVNLANLNEIENLVGQIVDERDKATDLRKQIEDLSRSKFAKDYSKIFHEEASIHSKFKLKESNNEFERGIGYAELYGGLGLILISVLLFLVLRDFFIPEPNFLLSDLEAIKELGISNVTYSQLLIPFYLKKIIVLALLLFSIRFSFKQFTIHKHLHTVNKHRANILDSFDFLYKNLKDSGDESRDQYLIEVAKSIFNLNDTGYVKNESKDSISFIDNFKFFKDQS